MAPRALARTDAERLLPLKPAWFHILLTLSERSMHGYAIRQAVEARTDGRIRLWPATLYGSIGDMEDAGLIEETEPGEVKDSLERRTFRLTAAGRRVLVAETERLEHLVKLARASIGKRTPA